MLRRFLKKKNKNQTFKSWTQFQVPGRSLETHRLWQKVLVPNSSQLDSARTFHHMPLCPVAKALVLENVWHIQGNLGHSLPFRAQKGKL